MPPEQIVIDATKLKLKKKSGLNSNSNSPNKKSAFKNSNNDVS
jgi:hypothetical protein